jgi:hypothetical protein
MTTYHGHTTYLGDHRKHHMHPMWYAWGVSQPFVLLMPLITLVVYGEPYATKQIYNGQPVLGIFSSHRQPLLTKKGRTSTTWQLVSSCQPRFTFCGKKEITVYLATTPTSSDYQRWHIPAHQNTPNEYGTQMHHPNYSLWYLGSLGTLAISFKRIPVAGVTVPSYLLLSLMMRWVKWTFAYKGCWIFQSYKPPSSYLNFSLILYWFFFLVFLPLFSREVCLLFTCTFFGSINLNIFYKKKSYNVINCNKMRSWLYFWWA